MKTIKFGRLPIEQEDGTIKVVDLEWLVVEECSSFRKSVKGITRRLLCKSFPFSLTYSELMDFVRGKANVIDYMKSLQSKYTVEMFNLHEQELIANYPHWHDKKFWEMYTAFRLGTSIDVEGLNDQLDYHVLTTDNLAIQISYITSHSVKLSDSANEHCRYYYSETDDTLLKSNTLEEFPLYDEYGIRPVIFIFEPTNKA